MTSGPPGHPCTHAQQEHMGLHLTNILGERGLARDGVSGCNGPTRGGGPCRVLVPVVLEAPATDPHAHTPTPIHTRVGLQTNLLRVSARSSHEGGGRRPTLSRDNTAAQEGRHKEGSTADASASSPPPPFSSRPQPSRPHELHAHSPQIVDDGVNKDAGRLEVAV
jgi:hypothetical protein